MALRGGSGDSWTLNTRPATAYNQVNGIPSLYVSSVHSILEFPFYGHVLQIAPYLGSTTEIQRAPRQGGGVGAQNSGAQNT